MTEKICPKCNNQRVIEKDDKLIECECEFINRITRSMDHTVRMAECLDAHISHPLVDMGKQSCFVLGKLADIRAIIKLVIIKNWPKYVRITSDALIRNIFVGNGSKAAKGVNYEGEIYSNLQEYMEPPNLMIVKLNELSYKNKAAAGALEEALMCRISLQKPTWVVNDIDRPFTLGSHAYSESVMNLIHSEFKSVVIPTITPRKNVEEQAAAYSLMHATEASGSLMNNESISKAMTSRVQAEEDPPPRPRTKQPIGIDPENPAPRKSYIQSAPDNEFESLGSIGTIGQGNGRSKKFRGRS